MAFPGGMFKVIDPALTKDPRDPTQRRYYDCFLWGVVGDEPIQIANKKGEVRLYFPVRYRRHIVCYVSCAGKNPFVYESARMLHKKDWVVVLGKMYEFEYKRKNKRYIEKYGPTGKEQHCDANLILPAKLFLLMMRQGDLNVESDSIEGLEDFLTEYDENDADPVFGMEEQ